MKRIAAYLILLVTTCLFAPFAAAQTTVFAPGATATVTYHSVQCQAGLATPFTVQVYATSPSATDPTKPVTDIQVLQDGKGTATVTFSQPGVYLLHAVTYDAANAAVPATCAPALTWGPFNATQALATSTVPDTLTAAPTAGTALTPSP